MIFHCTTVPAADVHPAVELAQRELIDHLSAACPGAEFGPAPCVAGATFVLGTFEDLGGDLIGQELSNDRWEDRTIVRSEAGHGGRGQLILSGSNPRSVLFAVYTYLDALGFAWLIPGEEGCVVPRLSEIPLEDFAIDHTASLMYRGFGLAGAYDGARGEKYVEWMARNRFNYLFMEGSSRRSSYEMELGRELTPAEARRHDERVAGAAKRRGLLHEKMGHGWTARALNVKTDEEPTPEQLGMAGELDGERAVDRSNNQLCLSNPRSHERMVEEIVAYAGDHPELDVLGVWMADGFNNWCECESCRQVHPSDLWVRLINEVSEAVHEARPDLRVEVLGYSVLMEPPPNERIDNRHGNVILMFAPFLRCYKHTLDDPECVLGEPLGTFPPANRLRRPKNYDYFRFLQGWLSAHEGTNYIFDYYCWLPIKRDFFQGNVPEAMCRDLNSYPDHGIMGLVDCARAQSFWPTPLARWMQARASWDSEVDYRAERRSMLKLAYGPHAGAVDDYLTLAYECLLPEPHAHGIEEERRFQPDRVERFKRELPGVREALSAAAASSSGARKKLLQAVDVHAAFTLLHLEEHLAEAAGDHDRAKTLATRMHELAKEHADVLDGLADPPELAWVEEDMHRRIEKEGEPEIG